MDKLTAKQSLIYKHIILIISEFFIFSLLSGLIVFLWKNAQIADLNSKIDDLQLQLAEETIPSITPDLQNTPEQPALQKDWEKHKGEGYFKFSIMTPKNSYVCIGYFASGGDDDGCWPEGVFLENKKYYPYGIEFTQTTLEANLEELVKTFHYDNYTQSDINFDGADNQIMIKGTDTIRLYINNYDEWYAVNYTKYLFTKDGNVYMPVIYTDKQNTDYELYQQILKTWKFEK